MKIKITGLDFVFIGLLIVLAYQYSAWFLVGILVILINPRYSRVIWRSKR